MSARSRSPAATSSPARRRIGPSPAERAGDDWRLLAAEDTNDALEQLFDRHKDFVFRTAWGLVGERTHAEDVTQEVFLRLAQGRRRWRPRARFRTLLYRITVNTARELGRRHRREASLESADEPSATPPAALGELDDLARALGGLPGRQREAVVLRLLEGRSTRETAAVMGCRTGTVKAHLHRALAALRLVLSS